MEGNAAYCLMGAAFAFALGWFGVFAIGRAVARGDRNYFGTEEKPGFSGVVSRFARGGIALLNPLARRLVGNRRIMRCACSLAAFFESEGIFATPVAMTSIVLAGLLAAFVLGWAFTAHAVGGVAVALCAGAVFHAAMNASAEKRCEKMREAVPDVLRSMSACFRSGQSLLQTMQQVGDQAKGRIGALFLRAAHTIETGGSTREALAVFEEGDAATELAFVAVALDVQHQTGGSMEKVLDAARESIEGELALARSLRVQTAQAKLSARIVSVMPLVLVVLFSLVSDDFLAPFFASLTGFALLVAAVAMQVSGVLIVRRMLRVEVG